MEIEIVTTKKKLSMATLKQMPMASIANIKFAMQDPTHRVLGYINGFRWNKQDISVALIKGASDWALVPMYDTRLVETVSREQHPDGQEYHIHDVTYYSTAQKIGSVTRTSKHSTDKEHVVGCVKATNDLVKFAKGLHIYL